MGINERLISACASGNQVQSTIDERPYDLIRAASYSKPLGLAIKRLRADGDPKAGNVNTVIYETHKVVYQTYPPSRAIPDRAELVKIAVMEWFYPQCTLCKGAREARQVNKDDPTKPGQLLATCGDCHGSGLRYFKDEERAFLLKRPLTHEDEQVLRVARAALVQYEGDTNRAAVQALEHAIPDDYVKV